MGHRECASESCVANVCRGVAAGGDACTSDSSCEADRLCCPDLFSFGSSFCGELNRGCAGSIGDSCGYDYQCFDRCNAGGFCTKTCVSNAECGKSPWGVPNACETNGIGDKICFPGCTSSQQCYDNLDSTFYCWDALDSAGQICAAE